MSPTLIWFIATTVGCDGGASKAAVDTLRGLIATTNPITLFTFRAQLPPDLQHHAQLRVLTPPLDMPLPSPASSRFPLQLASWLKQTLQDYHRRRTAQGLALPSLILVNSFGSHPWLEHLHTALGAELWQVPRVLIVHGSPGNLQSQGDESFRQSLAILREYPALSFVSKIAHQAWRELGALDRQQTFDIPNCCDEAGIQQVLAKDREELRLSLGLPAGKLLIVCPAPVLHRKGQDLLLTQWPSIVKQLPHAKLVLVQGEAQFEQTLRKQAAELGVKASVHWQQRMPRGLELIRAAGVVVMPSRAEAMPLAVLEAMALGTPVVASSVDGIPEAVEHERSALLFPLSEPTRLADGILRLATDRSLAQQLSLAASQRYAEQFSQALNHQRYRDLALQLLR